MIQTLKEPPIAALQSGLMKANVFRGPGKYGLETKAVPRASFGDAVIRVRLTTICGTDVHIVNGEYPVENGLTIGHEAVGVIQELGMGVSGYEIGQRVLFGAITVRPVRALSREPPFAMWRRSRWMAVGQHDRWCAGGVPRVPFAQANLAVIPETLDDE